MQSARSRTVLRETTSFEAGMVVNQLVGHTISEVEQELILKTLNHFAGNRTRASITLGISVRCLRDKINQFRAQGVNVLQAQSGHLRIRPISAGP
jgi:DNA-binding protein Fis